MVDAVEKYAREPLPEPDLEQAKRQVEAGMVYGAQGARGRAQALVGAQMLTGDWQAWQRRVARVRELTAADVQRAARATLTASHRSIVWVRPEKAEGAKLMRGAPHRFVRIPSSRSRAAALAVLATALITAGAVAAVTPYRLT